jgi:hypothetical protein
MAHARISKILGLALLVSQMPPGSARSADVLTQHYNNARTGAILTETVLNTTNVKSQTFGKLWTLYADGQIVAQPLYVSGLEIDTSATPNAPPVRGKFNAVIIATMHNTVYVYDADKENRGPDGRTIPLWARWLGPPKPSDKEVDMWSTNDPEWGIVSTPVVSDDRKTLYVTAWHNDQGKIQHRLHALDLASGAVKHEVDVGPSSRDPNIDCGKDQIRFNPCRLKQRSALLLSNGLLYLGFGGDKNKGALFVFDAQTLQQKAQWAAAPTGTDGGIWQSGQGPAADQQGNVYFNTGNGTFDGTTNFGNSTLKISHDSNGVVVKDYFTPCNVNFLNATDLDLGSAGPLLIPDAPRIVTGGKEGVLYVLDRDNFGKHVAGPGSMSEDCTNPNIIQQVRAFEAVPHDGKPHFGNIHGSPVYWKGPDTAWIYAWGENSPLKAYPFAQGRLQNVDAPKQSGYRPPLGMPGGMLALSADGDKAGSGILWAVVPFDGDANQQRGVKGIVLALDAQDITRTLWTSEQVPGRDSLGLFAKFNPPLVVDGKVFVATYGDQEQLRTYGTMPEQHPAPSQLPRNYYVAIYGVGPTRPGQRAVVNQARDDVTVVKAELEPLTLQPSQCAPNTGGNLDCTGALARATGAESFHRVTFGGAQLPVGCSVVRVTTASRQAAVQNGSGIGFWSSDAVGGNQAADDSGRFVDKAGLKQTGSATLKDGTPAVLHQFVGIANCAVGQTHLTRLFKPYMRFEDAAAGPIYQNWDMSPNYQVQGPDTLFDRSRDVLQ